MGYFTLHVVDHVLQSGPASIPALSVADKTLTEILLLPEDAPCREAYLEVVKAIRGGATWCEVEERLFGVARALEREDRPAEAEDVFRTIQEAYRVGWAEVEPAETDASGTHPVAADCGEGGLVRALLGQGRTLRKVVDLEGAEQAYRRARERAHGVGLHDEEALARAGLAAIVVDRGKLEEGRAAFGRLWRDCQDVRISADVGGAILREWAAALEDLDPRRCLILLWRAFETYSDPVEGQRALYQVAQRLRENGLYEAARKAFELLLSQGPAHLSLLALRGLLEIACRTRDLLLFRRTWRELSSRADDLEPALWAECCRLAARMQRALGRHEEARVLLHEARLSEPPPRRKGRGTRPPEMRARTKKISKRAARTDPDLRQVVEALESRWQAICG